MELSKVRKEDSKVFSQLIEESRVEEWKQNKQDDLHFTWFKNLSSGRLWNKRNYKKNDSIFHLMYLFPFIKTTLCSSITQ